MKLFGAYLREKRRVIVYIVVAASLLAGSFRLYNLPIEAVAYPMILCLIIGIIFILVDFNKVKKVHRILDALSNCKEDIRGLLPESTDIVNQDYRAIIEMLDAREAEKIGQNTKRYNAMVDYYTVWCHQIKTPIASMRLTLQNEDSDVARRLLSDLGRIENYVEMVLSYLRLSSDSTDYVFREVELDSIIKPAIKKFSSDFIMKKLSLDFKGTGHKVLTDEKWLSFVIEQVISNAVKYTKTGGIKIYFEEPDRLCIKDTGIGIAPEDLPRIFENGYTGFNGRSDKKASGIGLYLCKKTCDRLGHKITAQSKLSEGTTIQISFGTKNIWVE